MKTPEQVWDSMEIQMDRGVGQNFAQRQIEATLVLAEQVKRIADLLEQTSIENDDGTHTLFMIIHDETR